MKRSSIRGFTLIEILTVIVVILIIAALVVNAAGYAQRKAARARAEGEIKAMSTACESYKADNGTYPRGPGITEGDETAGSDSPIDPKKHGNPRAQNYQKASQYLYQELSGDKDLNGVLSGASEPTKGYMNFDKNMLNGTKDANGSITKVNYIQDPFGNSYGYSTAGAKAEETFRAQVAAKGSKAEGRSSDSPGFNPTFDLWSTADTKVQSTSAPVTEVERNQWVKNW
jgi:prepilin-type N-terminal cleavage/methylation domain-containing protein